MPRESFLDSCPVPRASSGPSRRSRCSISGGCDPFPGSTVPPLKKRLGVIGSFVWDVIYGRDPRTLPVEEWGGIAYTLSGFDAALGDDWEIVPLIKVGEDLAARAREFLGSLKRIAPD